MNNHNKKIRNIFDSIIFYCLLGAVLVTLPGVIFAENLQSLESIHNSVIRFIKNRFDASTKIEVIVGLNEHRLRLQQCPDSLQATWSHGEQKIGNTSVRVRCAGRINWTLYVPVTIKLFKPIMVASTTLTRGEVLQESDYTFEERDISNAVNGYITSPDEYHGHLIKRPIRINQVITPHMLQIPKLIRKGERVLVLAETGTLQVRSAGIALEDGIRGDTIRIRNSVSKRVIEGRIISPGVVRITL